MVFSSMVFLCVFLPAVLILYYLIPGITAGNILLLCASLLFYAYGEPVYILLMVGSAFGNYLLAAGMDRGGQKKRRVLLVLAVAMNIGLLVIFKYTGFLVQCFDSVTGLSVPVPQIRLPIGISFYTFQAMSYVIDVYRSEKNDDGALKADRSFLRVLLYISFFPQLIAGPIVKYHDIAPYLYDRKKDPEKIHAGIRRFILGLSKKVLIANVMAQASDTLFQAQNSQLGAPLAWLGAVSYMMQIYFDFSGYSDMAIGMGLMFGFRIPENFNYPYTAASIRDFWRRWHMSLTGWFREYLYIPLGGNRRGKARTVLNKFIVFACTGIWHGANITFLVWGLYHGVLMMIEEMFPALTRRGGRVKTILQHLYVLLAVLIGFVFFNASDMRQGFSIVRAMFAGTALTASSMSLTLSILTPLYLTALAAAVIFSMPVVPAVQKKLGAKKGYAAVTDIVLMLLYILCLLSLAGGSYNPFIYFRF